MSASTRVQWLNPGWRMVFCALAWLLGLGLQMQQPALWPMPVYAALAVLAVALLLAAAGWRAGALPLLMAAAGAVAIASTGLRADARLAERLSAALEGQDLRVTGVVASLPQAGASGLRFRFEVEQATWRGQPVQLPPLLALGWYNNFNDEAVLDDARAGLRAGQRWRLPLRLKQPHGALNPAGFDVELMWFEQGLGATGYVRAVRAARPAAGAASLGAPAAAERLADAAGYPVERLRQTVRDAIYRQVADVRTAGVLAALAVGDQGAIERDDWELFRQTGIAHLVSISGVHVTMLAWLASAAAGRLWRRSPRLMRWLPAPTAGRWLGLALATGYALLAGWGVPAQRTVLMLVTTGALRSGGQRWPWGMVLLAAAVVVTLLDPWALLQPGFWLSFMAVGLLMAAEPDNSRMAAVVGVAGDRAGALGRLRGRAGGAMRGHLRGQLVATLGLAPLSLVFFQQLSLVGFAANLLAIPLVTLLITPLALLGMLVPLLWSLAAVLVQAMVWGLAWLAQWPFAVYSAPVPPAWAVACGLLGAVLGVLPLPWRVRVLSIPLLLPLVMPPVARPAPGSFELLAPDIGQGTAVLVRTRNHLLVYDTGPQYTRDSDAGQRVLLPLLRARGEPRIDLLMLSHRDIDHVGGAASLLAGLPVLALQSSLEPGHALLTQASQRAVPHRRCDAGQHWQWDGVQFDVLHPTATEHAEAQKSNALSCVLRIADAHGRSALLTGDIEAPQEAALLQRQAQGAAPALASTVLLVPHHGSRTSSTADFLAAVRPQIAVVQAGYRSRYGHPAPDVLARYADQRIEIVRSDRCGAWLWHDGAAACTRDVRRRYWHWTLPVGGAIVATQEGPRANPR